VHAIFLSTAGSIGRGCSRGGPRKWSHQRRTRRLSGKPELDPSNLALITRIAGKFVRCRIYISKKVILTRAAVTRGWQTSEHWGEGGWKGTKCDDHCNAGEASKNKKIKQTFSSRQPAAMEVGRQAWRCDLRPRCDERRGWVQQLLQLQARGREAGPDSGSMSPTPKLKNV
jgi:hypothetical protein